MSATTSIRGDVASAPLYTSSERLPIGRLEAAHARWNDYLGSAAADDAQALLDRPSLYEIASLTGSAGPSSVSNSPWVNRRTRW